MKFWHYGSLFHYLQSSLSSVNRYSICTVCCKEQVKISYRTVSRTWCNLFSFYGAMCTSSMQKVLFTDLSAVLYCTFCCDGNQWWHLDFRLERGKGNKGKKLLWVVLNRVRMYHKLMSGMLGSVWGPLLGSRGVVLVGSRVQSPLRLWGTILVSAVSLGEKFNLGIGYIFVQSALLHLKIPNNSNSGIPLSWQDGKLG